jgi:hypothetical protein
VTTCDEVNPAVPTSPLLIAPLGTVVEGIGVQSGPLAD